MDAEDLGYRLSYTILFFNYNINWKRWAVTTRLVFCEQQKLEIIISLDGPTNCFRLRQDEFVEGDNLINLFAGCCAAWATGAFLNHRPFPTYSLENMPDTEFSCRDKILGGYYADAETQCQMFHVCVKVAGVGVSF